MTRPTFTEELHPTAANGVCPECYSKGYEEAEQRVKVLEYWMDRHICKECNLVGRAALEQRAAQ